MIPTPMMWAYSDNSVVLVPSCPLQNCPPAQYTNTQQPPSENVAIESTVLSISLPLLRFYRQLADTETITRVTNVKSVWLHVYWVQALRRDRKFVAIIFCSLTSKSLVSYSWVHNTSYVNHVPVIGEIKHMKSYIVYMTGNWISYRWRTELLTSTTKIL